MSKKTLLEKMINKGDQNGDVTVADPVNKRATLPNSKTQGEGMNKVNNTAGTPIEDTDATNNTKATGDASASNKASVSMKASAASAANVTASVKQEDYKLEVAFEGEDLSEEFKERAVTIFEAAVNAKVAAITEELEEKFHTELEEQLSEFTVKLSEQVDQYISYVAEQWMEANELAIETSLRSEITEEFIEGMKRLFTENYIEIPEEKLDVLDNLTSKVEELEEKLNESINDNMTMVSMLKEYAIESIKAEVAQGLSLAQQEKFNALAEGIEFNDEESYEKKLKIVKENYFKEDTVVGKDIVQEEVEQAEEQPAATPQYNGPVANYVKAISRSVKK